MNKEQVRALLRTYPFEPFRVYVSSGRSFDVPHPEMAMLLGNQLLVATEHRDEFGNMFARLSLLHITHVEPLRNGASQKQSESK